MANKVRSWAGLDVHAAKVVVCVVDAESGEMTGHRLSGDTTKVVAFCAGLPGPTRVAYEAGPTGFGLARALLAAGVECVIAAPGKIERPAQDRVKTDQRDAERLVRLLMINALHAVRVPGSDEEALRDLVRAREDLRGDLMRARNRLGKLLLRYDVRYEGTWDRWTARHRAWLSRVELGERGAQATLLDYLGAIDALTIRREQLEATIGELAPASPWAQGHRQAQVPARDRHADGGRVVCRGGRLRAVRAARAADELPRPRPGRTQHRRGPPTRPHHQVGFESCAVAADRSCLALVRHEALCCIPGAAGTKLEGRFVGLMAYPDPRGERNNRMPAKRWPVQVSGPGRRATRVIRRKLDCLNPNLQMTQRLVRRKDIRHRRHALRRLGSAAVATFGAWSVAQ